MVALFSITITFLFSRKPAGDGHVEASGSISGRLGFPVVGETFSFLSASNSAKGCYEFVRLRRLWYGKWFKTRIFGKIHIYVPSQEGARQIFNNEFVDFKKGYVKSMADAVGINSLLCVPHDRHRRIRRLLSHPFSMPCLSQFVNKFDQMLSRKLHELEQTAQSFNVLDFSMKVLA
ncbi:hypothetical protein M5689_006902 [Euphorbia peplus]|nr:hypothetical protein M5689_006902 [Euphorbia peplus]